MKKLLVAMLTVAMLAALLAGCGAPAPKPSDAGSAAQTTAPAAPSEPAKKDKPVLGVTLRDTTVSTFITQCDAMQEKCDEYGITMIVNDAREDVATQISQIENFMAMDVDYIFVNVFDAEGIKDTIKKAVDEGFFVIVHDATFDFSSLTFGSLDNFDYGYKIGQMAAEFINSNEELKNAESVEWGLETYTVVTDIIARSEGIKAAMEELAPNAKLVISQDVFSAEEAVSVTENWIQAYPNIKIICGMTDSFVYGTYQAFEAAGYNTDSHGVFGCDGTDQALQLIAEGTCYRGSVALTLVDTSKQMVDMIWDHWNGKDIEPTVPWGMDSVTAATSSK